MKNGWIAAVVAAAAVTFSMASPPDARGAGAEFSCGTAKLIVPWKPGGGTDVVFRIFANKVNDSGAKPKIQVVNISGQGGNKGAKEAVKSKPDGCTLFAIHQSAVTSYLNGRVDFTWDAFEPVALLTNTPEIVGAAGNVPYENMDDLVKAAKAAPGTLLTGATFGSTSQFMWLLLEDLTGVQFKYVPFDGTRERMTAILSNTIQLGTINVASGKKYIQGGELKALGIADDKRSDQLPDLPTLKEQGIDMVYALNRGIMVAKGTDVSFVGPAGYRAWFQKTYADHEKVAIKIGMYKKK